MESIDTNGFHGHPWNQLICMDSTGIYGVHHGIHGYPGVPWMSMESLICMDSTDVHVIHGSPWNPWVSMGPLICMDSSDIHGTHGYPWVGFFITLVLGQQIRFNPPHEMLQVRTNSISDRNKSCSTTRFVQMWQIMFNPLANPI